LSNLEQLPVPKNGEAYRVINDAFTAQPSIFEMHDFIPDCRGIFSLEK
jgi:hypothetical protein